MQLLNRTKYLEHVKSWGNNEEYYSKLNSCKTNLQEFWNKCDNVDMMLWLLVRSSRCFEDRKKLVMAGFDYYHKFKYPTTGESFESYRVTFENGKFDKKQLEDADLQFTFEAVRNTSQRLPLLFDKAAKTTEKHLYQNWDLQGYYSRYNLAKAAYYASFPDHEDPEFELVLMTGGTQPKKSQTFTFTRVEITAESVERSVVKYCTKDHKDVTDPEFCNNLRKFFPNLPQLLKWQKDEV